MTKILDMLSKLLSEDFSEQKDVELLKIFVERYNNEGSKAVKEEIENILASIIEEDKT